MQEQPVLGKGVRSRGPWRHGPAPRQRLWQIRRWTWRFARTPRAALVAAFGAAIVGWFVPDLRADDVLAWLRQPDRVIAWTRDVVVLRPTGGPGDGPQILRPQRVAGSGAFRLCAGRRQASCVVDGDTIWHGGVKIRLADIDTPEVFSPKCASEAALGRRATGRLQELLNAGPFEVVPSGSRDADRYGRKLRIVVRDGRSLGDILIAEGLARRWDGARRSWCG
jgi:endonuclease YncB( thermonuclease family)